MKTNKTISVDAGLWKKFGQETQNKSKKINEWIKEFIDSDVSDAPQDIDIISQSRLSGMRTDAVKEIIRNRMGGSSVADLVQFLQAENIYSRVGDAKSCLKAISKDKIVPYQLNNGKLEPVLFRHACGTQLSPDSLGKTGGNCASCGAQIVDISEVESISFE